MRPSKLLLVAIAMQLLWGVGAATAQEDELEEKRETFDDTIDVRTEGNAKGKSAQKRIDALSDETDTLTSQYRTTLKQIDAIQVYNDQMRNLIASQEAEMESVASQLGQVEIVGRSVTPLMLRMIDTLDQFVELDVPFLPEEREERVAELRETMARADVTRPEKFRQIMEAYQIENEYGRTIEAYRGTLDIDGKATTVDFLRFGRIALVYQSLDEAQSGYWDRDSKQWKSLDSTYRSAIRDGLRIARKQSAPDLIRLPLPAARNAGKAS